MKDSSMLSGSNWRQYLPEVWNINIMDQFNFDLQSYLWTTRCSKTKAISQGFPKEMYVSAANLYFYRFVEQAGVRFGILSDKYGLHMDDESLGYYDIHPEALTSADKCRLGETIGNKAQLAGFGKIIFYNASPLMSKPYFEMLSRTGLNVSFTTRLSFHH